MPEVRRADRLAERRVALEVGERLDESAVAELVPVDLAAPVGLPEGEVPDAVPRQPVVERDAAEDDLVLGVRGPVRGFLGRPVVDESVVEVEKVERLVQSFAREARGKVRGDRETPGIITLPPGARSS